MRAYYGDEGAHICVVQLEPKAATVDELWVHPQNRGKGAARKLMTMLCRDADKEGVTLWLEPAPFSTFDRATDEICLPGTTGPQLRKFYRTFGFRMKPAPYDNTMVRRPRRGNR